MGTKIRRQYSGEEKVAILKRHLVNGEPISDICDALKLNPNLIYRWQKIFFENGAKAYEGNQTKHNAQKDRRMTELKQKLVEKDGVISELATELIQSKKTLGSPEREMG